MTVLAVTNQFLGILNRRDITPALTQQFINYGAQRVQRNLRVPSSEKLTSIVTTGTPEIPVPTDLLEVISIMILSSGESRRLVRKDLDYVLKRSEIVGTPDCYHRIGANFYLAPMPPSDSTVWVHYYQEVKELNNSLDTNWLTEIAPTLVVYAALSYSADYFLDDRKSLFEQTYISLEDEFRQMALQDDLVNASVSPAYQME
jgi:hypothetical protein